MSLKTSGRAVSKEYRDLYATMPTIDGKVVDPKYVPAHQRRAYEDKWLEWSQKCPVNDWDPFLHQLVAARAKESERARYGPVQPPPEPIKELVPNTEPENLDDFSAWAGHMDKVLRTSRDMTEQARIPDSNEETWE